MADQVLTGQPTQGFNKESAYLSWRQSLENYLTGNKDARIIGTTEDANKVDSILLDIMHQMDKAIREGQIDIVELNEKVLEFIDPVTQKPIISPLFAADIRGFLEGLRNGQIKRRD